MVRVPGNVITIKFVDERLFCGLDDGAMLVYSRNDGETDKFLFFTVSVRGEKGINLI